MSATDDIDSQLGRMEPKASTGHTRNDSSGMPKRIQEALIIAALLGMVGSWWTFGQSIAVLRATQEFQQRQIDKVDRRQDMLEGRIARGDVDALDK